jgi:hypothetical protein
MNSRFAIVVFALLLMALGTGTATAEAPILQAVDAADAQATGLLETPWQSNLVFLTTPLGYRIYDMYDDSWTDFEEPGVPDREVTALTGVPRLYHRLLTGRLGSDGHGRIELGFPLAKDNAVHVSRAGAVADLSVTGYYNPLLLACTRSLGGIAGELVASADTGATWYEITGHGHHDLTDMYGWFTSVFYVAGDQGVMFTADGGATWQPCNDGLPAGTVHKLWSDGPVFGVPGKDALTEPSGLFASMDDGLYRAATATAVWQRVLAEPAPRQILVQQEPYGRPATVLVVTADGRLLAAEVADWQWTDLSGSLQGSDIVGVVSNGFDLLVATTTDGLFKAQYFQGGSAVPEVPAVFHLSAAPNPFNPRTSLRFDLPRAGAVNLGIFDLAGRRVRTLLDASLTEGRHEVTWDGLDASGRGTCSGSYIARLEFGGACETIRVSLVR